VHAHIILWLSDEDKVIAGNEITACHPGKWNAATDRFDPPDDGCAGVDQADLLAHMQRKQQHNCRDVGEPGCRQHGECRWGKSTALGGLHVGVPAPPHI
jgi:hypothetical protein